MCGTVLIDEVEEIKRDAMLDHPMDLEEEVDLNDPNYYNWEIFEVMNFQFIADLYAIMGYDPEVPLTALHCGIWHRDVELVQSVMNEAQALAIEYQELKDEHQRREMEAAKVEGYDADIEVEDEDDVEVPWHVTIHQDEEEDLDLSGYEADEEMERDLVCLPREVLPEAFQFLMLKVEPSVAPEKDLKLQVPETSGIPRSRWMFYPDPEKSAGLPPDQQPHVLVYCRPIFHQGEYVYTPIHRISNERFLVKH